MPELNLYLTEMLNNLMGGSSVGGAAKMVNKPVLFHSIVEPCVSVRPECVRGRKELEHERQKL